MKKEVIQKASWTKENYILAISAGILIIAAFLTWVKSSLSVEELGYQSAVKSISGIATQVGYVTLGIGIIIFIMLFMKKTPKITAIILGGISTFIGGCYWYYITSVPKQIVEVTGEVGIGVILTTFAGIVLIIGGIMEKRRN